MSTLADLDGTDDAASWLHAGHVLDQQEVDFLRGLQVPDTYRTTPDRPAPHFGPVHVGQPARFSQDLRVGDYIIDPDGRAVQILARYYTGTEGEILMDVSGGRIPRFTVEHDEEWALARVETRDLGPGFLIEDGGGADTVRMVGTVAPTQWEDGPGMPPTEYAVRTVARDGKLTSTVYTAADTQWIIHRETE